MRAPRTTRRAWAKPRSTRRPTCTRPRSRSDAAEHAFEDDPESPETFALSYVALRTSQLVESKANSKAAEADLERAEQEYQKLHRGRADADAQRAGRSHDLRTAQRPSARRAPRPRSATAKRCASWPRPRRSTSRKSTRGTVIVLPGNVLFESGKSDARARSAAEADADRRHAGAAGRGARPGRRRPHRSARQPRSQHVAVAERAQAVMNFLVSRGVPAEAITAVGIGPDRPIADNNTRDGRTENRRVEIVIKPTDKKKKTQRQDARGAIKPRWRLVWRFSVDRVPSRAGRADAVAAARAWRGRARGRPRRSALASRRRARETRRRRC